jgi:hypothetical protein
LKKTAIKDLKVGSRDSAEQGPKKHRKNRIKSQKRTSFLSCNRKFKDKIFYTKAHDEDIPDEGPQLFLEERFSENLYDRIRQGLIEGLKGAPIDLPNPTLEVQNLTTSINEAWDQLLSLVREKNMKVTAYNAQLRKSRPRI